MGTTTLLASPLPPIRSRAPTAVSRGSCDRGVMAAASIPQGNCDLNCRHGCLAVPGTYRLSHGRRQSNEKHCKEQIIVRVNPVSKGLFEFAHECQV
jgi:hypothetical protein